MMSEPSAVCIGCSIRSNSKESHMIPFVNLGNPFNGGSSIFHLCPRQKQLIVRPWPQHLNTDEQGPTRGNSAAHCHKRRFRVMAFLQPVSNTLGGWVTTFPFYERPGHVGFGSYCVRRHSSPSYELSLITQFPETISTFWRASLMNHRFVGKY